MKQTKITFYLIIMALLAVILSSCNTTKLSEIDQASTLRSPNPDCNAGCYRENRILQKQLKRPLQLHPHRNQHWVRLDHLISPKASIH